MHEARTAGHLVLRMLRKLDSKATTTDILTKGSPPDVFSDLCLILVSLSQHYGPLTYPKRLCVSQEVESVLTASWEPSLCRLGGVMKMSDVDVSGSGRSRDEN